MPEKIKIQKGEKKDKYSHQIGGKVRGSPIDPNIGNDQRLFGTVVLSKKEKGERIAAEGKPEPSVRGRPGPRGEYR